MNHSRNRSIRVRENNKFYQKCIRQLLIFGRYNIIDLIYIRKKKSRSCICYKKGRYLYISVNFLRVSQEFRKLILY
jgi:hypothetical protein